MKQNVTLLFTKNYSGQHSCYTDGSLCNQKPNEIAKLILNAKKFGTIKYIKPLFEIVKNEITKSKINVDVIVPIQSQNSKYSIPHKVGKLIAKHFNIDFKDCLTPDNSSCNANLIGKNVLLLDDVIYTGKTMNLAIDAIDIKKPKKIIAYAIAKAKTASKNPLNGTEIMKYPQNLQLTIIDDKSLGKVATIKDAKDFMPEIKLTLKKSTGKEITNEFKVSSADQAVKLIKRLYPRGVMSLNERFFVIFFNNANRPIAWFNVSIGAKAATVLEPSYIVAAASKLNASAVIISHNHPSGNLVPSQADKVLTQKLANALFLINVKILDHVIATEDSYYSFRENGLEYLEPSNQNEFRSIAGLQGTKTESKGTKMESNTATQLNTLRQAINKALSNCLRTATPYVCSMAETEQGYITIEKQIIELCLAKQIAPTQAILLIESENNIVSE